MTRSVIFEGPVTIGIKKFMYFLRDFSPRQVGNSPSLGLRCNWPPILGQFTVTKPLVTVLDPWAARYAPTVVTLYFCVLSVRSVLAAPNLLQGRQPLDKPYRVLSPGTPEP